MKRFRIVAQTAIMFRGKAYRSGDEVDFTVAIEQDPLELHDQGCVGPEDILAFYAERGSLKWTEEPQEPEPAPQARKRPRKGAEPEATTDTP